VLLTYTLELKGTYQGKLMPSRSVCIAFFLQSALPQDTSSEAGDPIYRVLPKLAPAT